MDGGRGEECTVGRSFVMEGSCFAFAVEERRRIRDGEAVRGAISFGSVCHCVFDAEMVLCCGCPEARRRILHT